MACLTDIKQGSSSKCTIAGECLLPDLYEKEQHAIVPRCTGTDQSENIDLPSVILEVSVTAIDDTGKKQPDPMTMSLRRKKNGPKFLKSEVRHSTKRDGSGGQKASGTRASGCSGSGSPGQRSWTPRLHLRENNRLRALSNPLLLNEALPMRRRGASKKPRLIVRGPRERS